MLTDEEIMRKALELAKRGEGWTAPNPMVGAVIVNKGRIVGEGFHQKAGTPHAEIHALFQAREQAKGSTVYVTLEPCCHHGRTPPCTDALIKAEVSKVVIAMVDPNPKVSGGGINKLREAGIEVVTGVLEKEAKALNEVFITNIVAQRPFIALKSALTLDGKTATKTGSSKWITGEETRHYAHKLRHKYDAILVGIGTVLADDPQLTTRISGLKNPLRIIIDSTLKIPENAQILDTKSSQTIIFTGNLGNGCSKAGRLIEKGVEVIQCPGEDGKVDIFDLVRVLYDKGVSSVLVEGGAGVNGAFFDRHLVDKLYLFYAPKLAGSHLAPGMIGGVGISDMKDAVYIEDLSVESIGKDLLITGYPIFSPD